MFGRCCVVGESCRSRRRCCIGISEGRATKDHLVFRLVDFVLGIDKSSPAKGEGEGKRRRMGQQKQPIETTLEAL
jgi:hypothetical protein